MAAPSSCPPAYRLRQLLTGALPAGEQEDLTAHLDDCPACQRALEEQAGADPAFRGLVDEAVTRVLKAKAAQGLLHCAG